MPKINTYTDNASIENDDKLLTYDTQAAATKLTAFSTIWTWIQGKFNALTKQTGIAAADQLLMVKNGNTTGRIDYNVLAKAIIEQYAGSTLAGSNQSLQAAITALNSNSVPLKLLSKPNASEYALHLPSNGRYAIITIPNSGTDMTFVFATVYASGAVFINNLSGQTNTTFTTGTNTLSATTVTSSLITFNVLVIALDRSVGVSGVTIS